MKNERLNSTFAQAPYETRVMISMMEALLGQDKVEKVLTDLEAPSVSPSIMIDGRPLRFWSGLTQEQLDAVGISEEGREQLCEYFDTPSKPKKDVTPEVEAPKETTETKTPPLEKSK